MKVLTCEVGEHRLALRFPDVREVVRAVAVAPLPGAPAAVDGVVDFRGEVLPVLNARVRFGVPAQALSPDEQFVAVHAGSRSMLLRVDRVVDAAELQDANVHDVSGVTAAPPFVSGIVTMPDGMVLLHDPATFLTEAEAAQLDELMSLRGAQK